MKRLLIVPLGLVAASLPATASASPGGQLWASAGCGGCHTLAAAGSSGQVGPDLDRARPSLSRIAIQITVGGPAMPSFGGTLSAAEIQTLASWVASVAGGGSGAGASPPTAPAGPAPTTGATPGPGGVLSGMSVSEVRRLQGELARLGYFHHVVTGYYGPVTTAAVKAFQRASGLKPDGIWGPQSAAALRRRSG